MLLQVSQHHKVLIKCNPFYNFETFLYSNWLAPQPDNAASSSGEAGAGLGSLFNQKTNTPLSPESSVLFAQSGSVSLRHPVSAGVNIPFKNAYLSANNKLS